MGFFSWLFGNKDQSTVQSSSQQQQRDTSIQFRPNLVESLTKDHQQIVDLYSEILRLVSNKEYGLIGAKVSEFKRELQAHVIVENVQFYTYLEVYLSNDPTNLEFIQDVRKEMNGIAHAVVQFSRKYEKAHFNEQLLQKLTTDLENIGAVLTQRVSMEEDKLYPLYEDK